MKTIYCYTVPNIQIVSPLMPLTGNGVEVYCFNSNNFNLKIGESVLTAEEIARALRYRKKQDQYNFLLARTAVRKLLGRYYNVAPKILHIQTGRYKKPFILAPQQNKKQIHFNISHSENRVWVAFALTPLGVDVEKIPAKLPIAILENVFSVREIEIIKRSATPQVEFTKLWTRKEACLKATGQGLIDDLTSIEFFDGIHPLQNNTVDLQLFSFTPDDEFMVAVCCHKSYTDFKYYQSSVSSLFTF